MTKKSSKIIGIGVCLCMFILAGAVYYLTSDTGTATPELESWQIPVEEFSDEYYSRVYRVVEENNAAGAEAVTDQPTISHSEAWPENGVAIAEINGREYRYDPVYLYRLTGAAWNPDYSLNCFTGVNYQPEIVDLAEGSSTADFLSQKLKDTAVYMELLYLEAQANPEIITDQDIALYMENSQGQYQEVLSAFREYNTTKSQSLPIESLTKIVAAHENSKFYQGQSDHNYLSQVAPYQEKYTYIRFYQAQSYEDFLFYQIQSDDNYLLTNTQELLGNHTDDLDKAKKEHYQLLKEKYNVNMLK